MADKTTTAGLLLKTVCPACSAQGLELRIDCRSGKECTRVTVCDQCNRILTACIVETDHKLDSLMPDLACRVCGEKNAAHNMVCDIPAMICKPVVTCSSCGEHYGERPS